MIRLLRYLKLPTTVDVMINTLGNYATVFFTALYALVLVRVLSPSEYGVLSVLFAIAYVSSNILDFGITASIYSYLPKILNDREEMMKFIKTNLTFQIVLSVIATFILFLFFKELDRHILKLNVDSVLYFWTLASIPFFICQNFILNVMFSAKKFLTANIILTISNLVKTILLFVLIFANKVTILNVIFTFGIIGPIIFIVLILLRRPQQLKSLISSKIERGKIKMGYTLTFFVANQFFQIATRVDLFIISYFLTKEMVGYYGLSEKIILSVLTAVISITQVLSPQFAKVEKRAEVISLLKKSFAYMTLPAVIFLLAILTPESLYSFIFTNRFSQAANITRALSIPYILYGYISIPMLFFLYTVRRPVHLFFTNSIFLIVVSVGSYLTVPVWGVFGPPIVFLAGFLLMSIYIVVAMTKEYKKLPI